MIKLTEKEFGTVSKSMMNFFLFKKQIKSEQIFSFLQLNLNYNLKNIIGFYSHHTFGNSTKNFYDTGFV